MAGPYENTSCRLQSSWSRFPVALLSSPDCRHIPSGGGGLPARPSHGHSTPWLSTSVAKGYECRLPLLTPELPNNLPHKLGARHRECRILQTLFFADWRKRLCSSHFPVHTRFHG